MRPSTLTAWQRRNRGLLLLVVDLGTEPKPFAIRRLLQKAEDLRLPLVCGLSSAAHRRLAAEILTAPVRHEVGLRIDPRASRLSDLEARAGELRSIGVDLSTVVACGRNLPAAWRRGLSGLGIRGIAAPRRTRRGAALRTAGVGVWESTATNHFPSKRLPFSRKKSLRQLQLAAEEQPRSLHARIALNRVTRDTIASQQLDRFLELAADYRDRGMLQIATMCEAVRQVAGVEIAAPAKMAG